VTKSTLLAARVERGDIGAVRSGGSQSPGRIARGPAIRSSRAVRCERQAQRNAGRR
jgi:hypothetical protein